MYGLFILGKRLVDMIESQLIFPTQVFRTQFENSQELQKIAVPKFQNIEKDDTSPVRYSANGYTSYGAYTNILLEAEFIELKNFIDDAVKKCHQQTNLQGDVRLESSWFSIMRNNTYHEEHHHMPSVWSGVYYVQADNDHPGLTFVNRNAKLHWPRTGITQLTESNSPEVTSPAQTGNVIIFPSHVLHKVHQQTTDKERHMISFNYGI
jgi:uncharacterized protein (TIGR02466 family)